MILSNDWLVQQKAHLDFHLNVVCIFKGRHKMNVYVNPMQS